MVLYPRQSDAYRPRSHQNGFVDFVVSLVHPQTMGGCVVIPHRLAECWAEHRPASRLRAKWAFPGPLLGMLRGPSPELQVNHFSVVTNIGTRGACHSRSTASEPDVKGKVERFKAEKGKGRLAAEKEDFAAILDSLIVCKFIRGGFTDFYPGAARLYALVTGIDISPKSSAGLGGLRISRKPST